MEKIETTILRNLLFNNDYCRKVLPFIKNEYFENLHEKVVFEEICKFIVAYDGLATKEVLLIETEKRTDITEDTYKTICDYVSNLDNSPADTNWVTDTTEKWCRDRAIYLALMESIKIADGQDDKKNRDAIPTILQEALAISFDDHIGHDYLNDYENRFDSYHRKEDKIAFDLDYFNKITKGGIPNKTLNIALAGCVHPETKVKIRFRKIKWIEKETTIAEIKTLLDNGYEVEVDSPDGYVPVNFFINKGMYEEYELHLYDTATKVKCNESHLFETNQGWISAKSLEYSNSYWEFITKDGLRIGKVIKTNNQIPIVDINVNHSNHRYYTNGVSSHNTGVGKSLFMCHFAASVLLQGKNVLYITLEMAEEKIAERIDANLLNVNIKDIETLPKMIFDTKINSIAKKTQGTLIIKEYPTASAHAGHFRALLNELSLKKSFRPDIIFIDYINNCASSRQKPNGSANSYSYIKSIAEELRGLAVEFNVPIVSATQTTRSGFSSSDPDLTDTSESFGLPATADLMFALISTEELEQLGQIMVKQLKNRYNDPTMNKRFVVGIDRAKMRLFDVEQSAQNDILDSGQEEEYTYEEDKPKKQFSGFKF